MEFIPMSNGIPLPQIGLGTWLANNHEELEAALRTALDAGYRYFDTATVYGNEHVIGKVLKEYYDAGKLKREDIFLTTKLPFFAHEPAVAQKLLEKSLKNLHTNYMDLYLVHTPLPCKPKDDLSEAEVDGNNKVIPIDVPLIDTWKVLEEHYKAGVLKSIGISNFNARQIKDLYENATVKPHNLQVELHILFPQKELRSLCDDLNIKVTSFSTLGSPGRGKSPISTFIEGDCLNHPLTKELAKKYNKTPAQVLLRHAIQLGINVIPKSTNPEHLKQNIDVFDFKIGQVDQQRLENISEHTRLLDLSFLAHHPNYPFRDVY